MVCNYLEYDGSARSTTTGTGRIQGVSEFITHVRETNLCGEISLVNDYAIPPIGVLWTNVKKWVAEDVGAQGLRPRLGKTTTTKLVASFKAVLLICDTN